MLAIRDFLKNSGPFKSHLLSLLLTLKEFSTLQAFFMAVFLMSILVRKLREDFSAVIATVREQAFVHVNVVPHIVSLVVSDWAMFAHEFLILSVCHRVYLGRLVKAWIIVCKRLNWLSIGVTACCYGVCLLKKIIVIVL